MKNYLSLFINQTSYTARGQNVHITGLNLSIPAQSTAGILELWKIVNPQGYTVHSCKILVNASSTLPDYLNNVPLLCKDIDLPANFTIQSSFEMSAYGYPEEA